MKKLNKWLVALDLTEHDRAILQFTKLLSNTLQPERIEFVHVSQRLPDTVHVHLPDSLKYPDYDELFGKISDSVYRYFSDSDPVSFEILDGPVQFDLWHETWEKEVDLFIAGSKPKHKGRGLFPSRFVRKSFCSVLLVPQSVPERLEKIWIPSDFSELSGKALEAALLVAAGFSNPIDVIVHHVYKMPHGYYYQGFPENEVLKGVKKAAEEQSQSFLQEFNPGQEPITIRITELKTSYVADNIHSEAIENNASLILMAAGGKSRLSAIFLGSETEHMVRIEHQIPLLILKEKRNYVKLWELINPN